MAIAAQQQTSGYLAVRGGIRNLIAQGQYKVALRQLTMMPSTEVEWLDDVAVCYLQLGDASTALKLTEMVATDLPQNADAWKKLGTLRMALGDKEGAQDALLHALKVRPKSIDILCSLNRLKPFSRTSQRTRLLRKLALAKQTVQADKVNAWNALGRIEEAAGNYSEAFRYFQRSKVAAGVVYDRSVFDRHLEEQKALFDGKRPGLEPKPGQPRMVFVCGVPRSGTTLVESILCRHAEVGTVGEARFLMDSLTALKAKVRRSHGEDSDWGWYRLASEEMLIAARNDYLSRVAGCFPEALPTVIVDKLPMNALVLGYAQLILGNGSIICMSRHPLDVGLSNFSTAYALSQPFSHDLSDMGHMSQTVDASVAHYETVSGSGLRRQFYRRLVEAPEPEIRDLVAHVGLQWDAACLNPEGLDAAVRTASVNQVRAPINTNALNRWRHYKNELEPLVKALGGEQAIADWEALDRGEDVV